MSHRQCTAGHNDDDGNFALLSEVRRKGRKVEERGEVWEGEGNGREARVINVVSIKCRRSKNIGRTVSVV